MQTRFLRPPYSLNIPYEQIKVVNQNLYKYNSLNYNPFIKWDNKSYVCIITLQVRERQKIRQNTQDGTTKTASYNSLGLTFFSTNI